MTPAVTRCVSCGMEGYDIAPRRSHGGRRRKDGSPAQSQFCRWCWSDRGGEAREAAVVESKAESRRRLRLWVILGPATCQGCGETVYWRRSGWTNENARPHVCESVENSLARSA